MIKAKQKTEGIYLKSSITVHVFSLALEHQPGKNMQLFCTALGLTDVCLPSTETYNNTVKGCDLKGKMLFIHTALTLCNTGPEYDAGVFKFKEFISLGGKPRKLQGNLPIRWYKSTRNCNNYGVGPNYKTIISLGEYYEIRPRIILEN